MQFILYILFCALCIFTFSNSAQAVTDHCSEINGNYTGGTSFSGYKYGQVYHCYADIKAKGWYKIPITILSIDLSNCRCTHATTCMDLSYVISGTCFDSKIVLDRGSNNTNALNGTIVDGVVELSGKHYSLNLIKV